MAYCPTILPRNLLDPQKVIQVLLRTAAQLELPPMLFQVLRNLSGRLSLFDELLRRQVAEAGV